MGAHSFRQDIALVVNHRGIASHVGALSDHNAGSALGSSHRRAHAHPRQTSTLYQNVKVVRENVMRRRQRQRPRHSSTY